MIAKYYKILSVKQNASFSLIRHNYIKIIMPIHPENNPDLVANFHKINEAFYVLSIKENRIMYDRFCNHLAGENDENLTDDYIDKTSSLWQKRSMKLSLKSLNMSSKEFFDTIPTSVRKKDSGIGIVNFDFMINLLP